MIRVNQIIKFPKRHSYEKDEYLPGVIKYCLLVQIKKNSCTLFTISLGSFPLIAVHWIIVCIQSIG